VRKISEKICDFAAKAEQVLILFVKKFSKYNKVLTLRFNWPIWPSALYFKTRSPKLF